MKTLRTALPILLILSAPMAMLYPLWADPTSAGEDDVIYYYPLRVMVGDALRQGRWPLLNPYEATGMPLMGDPQSAVLYPPAWLFAALPPKLAYALTLFMAFSLAGGGALLYLRRLGLIRAAACFGAVAFMFCGFFVGHRVHWSVLHAGSCLPWGLWCIEGLRRRPGSAFAWMVPVAFLTIAAGHWPTLIHVGLIWAVYLLLRGRPLARSVLIALAAMAIAVALAGPQIDATRRVLAQATRNRIGYATAGENSFFPASGVLALFPMLLGCRTPNFFPTQWWGPWHLCETLGYVGLVTLALAGGAVWRLYRKPKPGQGCGAESPQPDEAGAVEKLRPMVRVWTWMALGAGVWMLGYYLPTYRLVHMLPILGVIRCPARMVLAVDMALASLAAIAIHVVAVGGCAERVQTLRRAVAWAATKGLPLAMVAALALVAAVGGLSVLLFGGEIMFFDTGGAGWKALKAVIPTNPAVWVQLLLALATFAAVRTWLGAPRRRIPVLVALVLIDLFFITRFVDVPAGGAPPADPSASPAAAWLHQHDPETQSFQVWGIGDTYHDRAPELLRPKTAHVLGISTINTYGPFQAPAHAQLLGFQIYGTNRDWAGLLRRNRLLSEYGVKYVLTARGDVREVIQSVRIPAQPRPPDSPNLLTGQWWFDVAGTRGETLVLRTPVLWRRSIAKQPVTLRPDAIYRISLDARGPDGGAANYLRADVYRDDWHLSWPEQDRLGLTAYPEQMGTDWRHFEWTFQAPPRLSGEALFRVFTMSERPIEVRNVALRRSDWDRPDDADKRLSPGEPVYRLVAELPALAADDAPVAIYENRLVVPQGRREGYRPATPEEIEAFKWRRAVLHDRSGRAVLPQVGFTVDADPSMGLLAMTLPAAAVYLAAVTVVLVKRSRSRR